jgi:hypothetical protein
LSALHVNASAGVSAMNVRRVAPPIVARAIRTGKVNAPIRGL